MTKIIAIEIIKMICANSVIVNFDKVSLEISANVGADDVPLAVSAHGIVNVFMPVHPINDVLSTLLNSLPICRLVIPAQLRKAFPAISWTSDKSTRDTSPVRLLMFFNLTQL